jgi:uncharacterized protein
MLARARPRFSGRTRGQVIQTTDLAELRELAAGLDRSYLFVQGPPGTGKTWTGARIEKAALEEGLRFRGVKKASSGNGETDYTGEFITSETEVANVIAEAPRLDLLAGTAWLFAHHDLGAADVIDTLVIDEAGQVALADALAMGTAARNVILLGDPLQLAQVSQGTHPPGTGASVLEHLLGGQATVPPDMGIFLDRTRRMHPDVCRFVSEVVYDGRLEWTPAVARQATAFGTGLRFVPVDHAGNAAVVFYSMATSSAEDVPRSLEFLFSRNRLNVAVSRAMCLAYVVANPRLLESRVRTIDQMRLVNALWRFVEIAEANR